MSDSVQSKIDSVMAEIERQARAFESWCKENTLTAINKAAENPQRCEVHQVPLILNLERTLESSFKRADEGVFDLEFNQCPTCIKETEQRHENVKWESKGIPRRLVRATVKGFLIKTSDGHEQDRRDYKKAIQDWVQDPGRPTFLVILGTPGVGKSHMAAALFKHWARSANGCAWVRWSDLVRQHRKGYDDAKLSGKALTLAMETDFVVIDDVIPCKGADEYEIWTEIIDARHDRRRPTIITSNESEESFLENCISHKGAIDRIRADSEILVIKYPSYR